MSRTEKVIQRQKQSGFFGPPCIMRRQLPHTDRASAFMSQKLLARALVDSMKICHSSSLTKFGYGFSYLASAKNRVVGLRPHWNGGVANPQKHALPHFTAPNLIAVQVKRYERTYGDLPALNTRGIYTVSTKKVTPCIHCHNSDKQCQILTEFWTNIAMSNCKQIAKFK